MQRFELSISPNYVPDWTEIEAVREIFQNALDAETTNPKANPLHWEFSEANNLLTITSANSFLTRDTLLMGVSTKQNDVATIGMFGEGYKLALLVLLRLGLKVTIYNEMQGEIWFPSMIKSRRFGSNIMVMDIQKLKKPDPSHTRLTFVIEDMTKEIFANIANSNLHMHDPGEMAPTSFGSILLDDAYKGKVFVNGLYICTKPGLLYGYNVKPEFLTIGRDRHLITDFDLSWVTSQMWRAAEKPGLAVDLIKKKAPDTSYIDSFESQDGDISNSLYADFVGTNGRMAIPVSSQEEYDTIKKSYKKLKPVIVEQKVKVLIYSHTDEVRAKAPKRRDTRCPQEILQDFHKKIHKDLLSRHNNEFERIIKKANGWELI